MSSEGVSRHRDRLLQAMAHVAAREGHAGASVGKVVQRARVSRATFYENFSTREDCLLAAYRQAAGKLREAVDLEALLAAVARDPVGARFVFVEGPGASPEVRCEHERFVADAESAIDARLTDPDGTRAVHAPAAALFGGVRGVISACILRGEVSVLACKLDALRAWLGSYALPDHGGGWSESDWRTLGLEQAPMGQPPRRIGQAGLLPRGRSALPRERAATARRQRLHEATAQVISAKGYATATVADIAAAARVTRGVFYSHFRSKEDAFIGVQTIALQESTAAAAGEFFTGASWPDRVWGGLRALLAYMTANPEFAYLGIVECHAAGEAAIRRTLDNAVAFTLFLEDGYRQRPEAESLPPLYSHAIAGAIYALLRRQILMRRAGRLPELLPQCAYVALAPFIGPEPALELVVAKSQAGIPAP